MSNYEAKANEIITALRLVLKTDETCIGLHEPVFKGNEWAYVKECLDSTFVSSVGPFVDKFEREIEKVTGSKHAVACSSGTAALHVALLLANVRPGDEVLIPALTFVATANAVHYCGATPHFVDIETSTLAVDANCLKTYLREVAEIRGEECFNRATGSRIKALIPMHCFGHPADLNALLILCEEYKLDLIEDAAESLGSFYRGKHTGTFGRLSALSFNGNKIVTTGGGGAILTNDSQLAKRAKHLTTTAKVPHGWRYFHDEIGFNYRLPNLNAALGCAQLEQLSSFLQSKRILAEKYRDAFANITGVRFLEEPAHGKSNYWLNAIILNESLASLRDLILDRSNALGIKTRPAWDLISSLPAYGNTPRMPLPNAKQIEARLINIPSSALLVEDRGLLA